jgi:1-acyl-sn-glycerol-3-phosphate acyltransferase
MRATDRRARAAAWLGLAWRWFATGFIFLFFGACGSAFSLMLFPLTLAWPHRASAQRVFTAVVHVYFRCLVAVLQKIGVMRLDVSGDLARIARGSLVVANHPTYLDVMILLALIPSACCVVKRAHWRNPCFLGIVRAAGYVSNAEAGALIAQSRERLERGYSMIVFPEGTRSPAHGLHPFARGFAHVALAAHATGDPDSAHGSDTPPRVVPLALSCDPPVFTKARRWYHVPPRPFRFRVEVLDAIDTRRWAHAGMPPALAARSVTEGVQDHIHQNLYKHGLAEARD